MHKASYRELGLPTLEELGLDLVVTTPYQRRIALLRPFLGLAAYAVAVAAGFWWLTPLILFLIFVSIVTATHDVVHGVLGLSRRQSEWALFLLGAVLLESGHAYRLTHQRHHSAFPSSAEDDPEGYPAQLGFAGALLYGPIFLARLWLWAYGQAKNQPRQRLWLAGEAALLPVSLAAGLALLPVTPAILIYVLLAMLGSWVYPLLTVYLPHKNYGETPLTQTHTLRGRIIPAIFLELTYHLEHHLYPQVPSHHLAELARRLDPALQRAGVQPWIVP